MFHHGSNLSSACGLQSTRFPETNEEADLVEELLTKALDDLSIQEHERILFDVHGFDLEGDDDDYDDPTNVDVKLKQLEVELENIEDKEAYLQAKRINESYVCSRQFRLKFLRHEKFQVQSAAQMLVQHFHVKRLLFGTGSVLGRDVRQSDLSENGRKLLESGLWQILPTRDVAGRTILFVGHSQDAKYEEGGIQCGGHEGHLCTLWYLLMKSLQADGTHSQGVVWVIMNFSSFTMTPERFRGICTVQAAIPHIVFAEHFCYSDPALRPYITGIHLLSNENERYRLRKHFGTREQIYFELQTFGIPTQYFPLANDGTRLTEIHREWLAMLRSHEDENTAREVKSQDYIIVPRRFDVLFGKSRLAREHTGTQRALHIVAMQFDAYEKSANRFQKTYMTERIISIVHESGGRFLKQDEKGGWIVAEEKDARNKVAHWFRHRRQRKPEVAKDNFIDIPTKKESDKVTIASDTKAEKRVFFNGVPTDQRDLLSENKKKHVCQLQI